MIPLPSEFPLADPRPGPILSVSGSKDIEGTDIEAVSDRHFVDPQDKTKSDPDARTYHPAKPSEQGIS